MKVIVALASLSISLGLSMNSQMAQALPEDQGDLIRCSPSERFVALDYFIASTRGEAKNLAVTLTVDRGRASGHEVTLEMSALYRMIHTFATLNMMGLRISVDEFVESQMAGLDSFKSHYAWQEAAFGFDPVSPENYNREITPQTCAHPEVVHLIRRADSPAGSLFSVDTHLAKTIDPLQYSMVLAREWISLSTDNSDLISRYNIALHSNNDLRKLTLELVQSPKTGRSICDRSASITAALSRALKKDCRLITPDDLETVENLDILDLAPNPSFRDLIRKSDLAGLTHLKSLSANGAPWFFDALIEGVFANTPNLVEIDFGRNWVQDIGAAKWTGAHHLRTIRLSRAEFAFFPGAFDGAFDTDPAVDTFLDLSRGSLHKTDVPDGAFRGLENLKRLDLSYRALNEVAEPPFRSLKSLRTLVMKGAIFSKSESILNSKTLPALRSLDLSEAEFQFDALGDLANLEDLNLARSIPGGGQLGDLSKIRNLKSLDLNDAHTYYYFGLNGRSNAWTNFEVLTKLETLKINGYAGEDSFGQPRLLELVESHLPPHLKTLETCHPSLRLADWKKSVAIAKKKNAALKVFVKDQCQGDSLEVPR